MNSLSVARFLCTQTCQRSLFVILHVTNCFCFFSPSLAFPMLVIMCLSDWCLVCIRRGCMHEKRSGFLFFTPVVNPIQVACALPSAANFMYPACKVTRRRLMQSSIFVLPSRFFLVGLYISLFYSILLIKILFLFLFHFINKRRTHESLLP